MKVICPNKCNNGYVKHYPESDKALFIVIKCPICKGKGNIDESQKSKIETNL